MLLDIVVVAAGAFLAVFLRVLAPLELPPVEHLVTSAVFHLVGHERSASDQASGQKQPKKQPRSQRRRDWETKAERRGDKTGQRRDDSWSDGDDDVGVDLDLFFNHRVFLLAIPLPRVHVLRVLPDDAARPRWRSWRRARLVLFVRPREAEKCPGKLRP